jgi:hypothetical protein
MRAHAREGRVRRRGNAITINRFKTKATALRSSQKRNRSNRSIQKKASKRRRNKRLQRRTCKQLKKDLLPVVLQQVTRKDLVCMQLRRVQTQTGCSTATLNLAINAISPYCKFELPRLRYADNFWRKLSGAKVIRLHGCVTPSCTHVFGPEDAQTHCPLCNEGRYDAANKPKETCYYFPLKDKLLKLLQLPHFRKALQHEWERPRNGDYIADVFDSARWKRVMGPATCELIRIGVLYCIDGIPAFKPHGLSLKPAEFMLLSLPPWERGRPENMLLHMLMPAKLKRTAMKKYFDWSAQYELIDLARNGVDGVKILHFGNTLDTPGRSELLQMESSKAYQGCPYCFHSWDKGLVRKPDFNGARQFLSRGSPCRDRTFIVDGQSYYFKDAETRPKPALRTTQTAADCCTLATYRKPFCGHKAFPMQLLWPDFEWDWSICEWMHDLKCVSDMSVKFLVGKTADGMYAKWRSNYDEKHRGECQVCTHMYMIHTHAYDTHIHTCVHTDTWNISGSVGRDSTITMETD